MHTIIPKYYLFIKTLQKNRNEKRNLVIMLNHVLGLSLFLFIIHISFTVFCILHLHLQLRLTISY